jgi:hypothetical protein
VPSAHAAMRSATHELTRHSATATVNTSGIQPTMGHLAFIRKILYKILPNQFHTVLLYNRGTEPRTILFYHPDEVQVPQVPRM